MTDDPREQLAAMRETARLKKAERDRQAAENRRRFPFASEFLDSLREHFPGARLLFARNADGETIGKEPT